MKTDPVRVPPKFEPVEKGRMTINVQVVAEVPGDDPSAIQHAFSYMNAAANECYPRQKLKVGSDKIPIDFGHVEAPGMIWLHNKTGSYSPVQLSEERLEEISKSILSVSAGEFELIQIPPGQGYVLPLGRSYPDIRLHSLGGEIQFSQIVYPK